MEKEERRSPLKEEPLPLAGEYNREKFHEILVEDFLPLLAGAIFLWVFTCLEWFSYVINLPRSPWTHTLVAVVFSVWVYFRWKKIKMKAKNYWMGAKGEVVVGQLLEGLRVRGFVPIHDIPCQSQKGKRFNIDHVLVGPKGIFAIETKTWRKGKGMQTINLVNGHLLANGKEYNLAPIMQVKNNAEYLANILSKRMGENFSVDAVLVFPDWFVEPSAQSLAKRDYQVLMLNPKALDGFLSNYSDILSKEKVAHLVATLSAYVHEEVARQE